MKPVKALNHKLEIDSLRCNLKNQKIGLDMGTTSFEFTYELAWKTVKDFFESKGEVDILGSRDAFQLAFKRGLVLNGEDLLNSIKSRQLSSHTDNEEYAEKIYNDIMNKYCCVFSELKNRLAIEEKKEI